MMNHATTEVFIEGLEVPPSALVGDEGRGVRYILDGMNAERILIAAECIGDGRFFLERASAYARERRVFGRPIGSNQGVQFSLARAYMARWRSSSRPRRLGRPPTRRSTPTAASASPRSTTSNESSGRRGSIRSP
jgi:acyl-CoA dehydrogenase